MVTLAHILLRWRTKIDADIPTAVALHAPGTSIHKLTFASSRCCHHRYESSVAVAAVERTLTIFTNPRKICRIAVFTAVIIYLLGTPRYSKCESPMHVYKIISNSIREKNKVLRFRKKVRRRSAIVSSRTTMLIIPSSLPILLGRPLASVHVLLVVVRMSPAKTTT